MTVLVADYGAQDVAESEFAALQELGNANPDQLHDAALISKSQAGEPDVLARQSEHGAEKGALAGAALGLFTGHLMHKAILGAAAGGGASALSRGLGKKKVEQLAETLRAGQIVLIAVVDTYSVDIFRSALTSATNVGSESAGLSVEQIAAALPPVEQG